MTDEVDDQVPVAGESPAEDGSPAGEEEPGAQDASPPPEGTFARGELPAGAVDGPDEASVSTAGDEVQDLEAPSPKLEEVPGEDGTGPENEERKTKDDERPGPLPARVEYDDETLARHVEALLFVALRPLSLAQMSRPLRTTFAAVRRALKVIGAARETSGVRLVEVGGGWQLRTATECADVVRKFLDVKPLRLSKAAMETLAVVAYRQPVTKPDVDDIRGVDSGSAVKLLLDRNLVRVLGRKEEPGRPLLYGTTQLFLEFFSLANLNDLPSLREYAELSEDGRRQLERDLFARAPDAVGGGEAERMPQARHWQDLVEVLGDDLGGLPAGVEIESEATGDPLEDYLLGAGRTAAGAAAPKDGEPDVGGSETADHDHDDRDDVREDGADDDRDDDDDHDHDDVVEEEDGGKEEGR